MSINSARDNARIDSLLGRIEDDLDTASLARLLAEDDDGLPRAEDLLAAADMATADGKRLLEATRDLATFDPDAIEAMDARIEVVVAEDAMTASVRVSPPIGAGRRPSLEETLSVLSGRGVVHGIDREALASALACEGFMPVEAIVARGTPPEAGISDCWELVRAGREVLGESLDDRVDFRDMPAVHAIAPGERLALRQPAAAGLDGTDVLGRAVPPPPPEVAPAFTAGPGTEERPDGIYATSAGELHVEDGRLSVSPIRVVEGDVDFSTGNIAFPGTVIVKGSIKDGFVVRSGGDVEVHGMIGAARVEARGSIRVTGGVITREEGVVAGGEISARFIENSTVEARGSIRVQKGVMHSRVETLGVLEVAGAPGSVVGGMIRAGAGLICKTLGSPSGTRTRVFVGEDYLVYRKLKEIEKALGILRDRLREIEATLGPLLNPPPGTPISGDHDALVARAQAVRMRILTDMKKLLAARLGVLGRAAEAPEGEVKVAEETLPGVVLSSRGVDRLVEEKCVRTRFRLKGEKIEVCAYE